MSEKLHVVPKAPVGTGLHRFAGEEASQFTHSSQALKPASGVCNKDTKPYPGHGAHSSGEERNQTVLCVATRVPGSEWCKRIRANFSPGNHGEEGRMALDSSVQSRILCT